MDIVAYSNTYSLSSPNISVVLATTVSSVMLCCMLRVGLSHKFMQQTYSFAQNYFKKLTQFGYLFHMTEQFISKSILT